MYVLPTLSCMWLLHFQTFLASIYLHPPYATTLKVDKYPERRGKDRLETDLLLYYPGLELVFSRSARKLADPAAEVEIIFTRCEFWLT